MDINARGSIGVKALLCDIGNVLVFFSRKQMFIQLAQVFQTTPQEIHDQLLAHEVYRHYEVGAVSSIELYAKLCQLFKVTPTPEAVFHAASDIFTPNKEIYPQIDALKKLGVRLVLLSNISPIHWDFLIERYPILDSFDAKVLSYEVGAAKPDALIYEKAIEAAGWPPEECLYLDDLPEFVEASKSHGIQGHIYSHDLVESLVSSLKSSSIKLPL